MDVDAGPEGWASDEKLAPIATDVHQANERARIHPTQDFVSRKRFEINLRKYWTGFKTAMSDGKPEDCNEDLPGETAIDRNQCIVSPPIIDENFFRESFEGPSA